MASLILAGGLLITDKIQTKRREKKEKKRLAYEARYAELEKEHSSHATNFIKRQTTNESQSPTPAPSSEDITAQRARSQDSRRSNDDPQRWVDEVVKEKEKTRTILS